jgi:hypothetical protein
MFAVCLNEEAKKMAPPSGCYGDAAFLQHVQNRPLDGQVVRSSKSEETSTPTPQPAWPKRQRAMSFNWTGNTSPDPARNILSNVSNLSRGILKITQINAQKGE